MSIGYVSSHHQTTTKLFAMQIYFIFLYVFNSLNSIRRNSIAGDILGV